MRIKSEKGITGIDITVSIILITLFVTIIATLIYMVHTISTSMERRAEATNCAINIIEGLKAHDFDTLENENTNDFTTVTEKEGEGENIIERATGYAKKITIIDYANLPGKENAVSGLVKQVTVEIAYKNGEETQTVALSTVIAKND